MGDVRRLFHCPIHNSVGGWNVGGFQDEKLGFFYMALVLFGTIVVYVCLHDCVREGLCTCTMKTYCLCFIYLCSIRGPLAVAREDPVTP